MTVHAIHPDTDFNVLRCDSLSFAAGHVEGVCNTPLHVDFNVLRHDSSSFAAYFHYLRSFAAPRFKSLRSGSLIFTKTYSVIEILNNAAVTKPFVAGH